MKPVVALLFFLPVAVLAQSMDPCMTAYNDEVTSIERDAKAKQKAGSDAAKQRAARSAETRMEAAARQAKKCQEGAKAKPVSTDECKARINARIAELERRFSGAALDPAQQNLRREEEIKLQAELNHCNRQEK